MSFSTSFEMRQRKKRWSLAVNTSIGDVSGLQGSAGVAHGGHDKEKTLGMNRSSRASLGQIYIPGDVTWSGEDPSSDGGDTPLQKERTYLFPWWWFVV